MTTSVREGRAKWPIVACSAGCLDCSSRSSSYAFILSLRKTKTLHFLERFQDSVCGCSQACDLLYVD